MYNIFPLYTYRQKFDYLLDVLGGIWNTFELGREVILYSVFITFICVCGMCLCSHVYGCTYFQVPLHLYTPACGGLKLTTCVFLIILHIILLRQSIPLKLELINSSWSTWPSSPRSPCFCLPSPGYTETCRVFPGLIETLGIWIPVFRLEQWALHLMWHFPVSIWCYNKNKKRIYGLQHFQYHSVYLFNEKKLHMCFSWFQEKKKPLIGGALQKS